MEKVACGAFSNSGSVSAGKRCDFCRLRHAVLARGKSDRLLGTAQKQSCRPLASWSVAYADDRSVDVGGLELFAQLVEVIQLVDEADAHAVGVGLVTI
jgi:hypothetical protein